MTIKSMTGFARADGSAGSTSWHWELRSVNGRGLDLRLRLPPGFEGLEPRIREAVGKRLARGSLSINLNVKRSEGVSQIRLNEPALRQVLAALDKLQAMAKVEAPRADGLLGIRGVLEFVEAEEGEAEARARAEAMLASLDAGARRPGDRARRRGRPARSRSSSSSWSPIEKLVRDRADARRRARRKRSASASRSRWRGCWRPACRSTRRGSTRRRRCWRRAPTWRRS